MDDPLQDVRLRIAITGEQLLSLLAVLLFKGAITPAEKDFVLHSTGNHATLNQPQPLPNSGVPTGGA